MTAVSAPAATPDTAAVQASPFDKLAYLCAVTGLYVVVGGLMFYGFWDKAVDGDFKIPPPLEDALFDDRASVQNAYERVQACRRALTMDLASTLGVTLTFGGTDGD